jgi:hypothetical protein
MSIIWTVHVKQLTKQFVEDVKRCQGKYKDDHVPYENREASVSNPIIMSQYHGWDDDLKCWLLEPMCFEARWRYLHGRLEDVPTEEATHTREMKKYNRPKIEVENNTWFTNFHAGGSTANALLYYGEKLHLTTPAKGAYLDSDKMSTLIRGEVVITEWEYTQRRRQVSKAYTLEELSAQLDQSG